MFCCLEIGHDICWLFVREIRLRGLDQKGGLLATGDSSQTDIVRSTWPKPRAALDLRIGYSIKLLPVFEPPECT